MQEKRALGAAAQGIVGREYLERGELVTVVVQWRTGAGPVGPRNVMIRRADGSLTVRPFRGLRRAAPAAEVPAAGRDRRWRPARMCLWIAGRSSTADPRSTVTV